jgi:hypothetical protein
VLRAHINATTGREMPSPEKFTGLQQEISLMFGVILAKMRTTIKALFQQKNILTGESSAAILLSS